MSDQRPIVTFDDGNPEWTDADFARAQPIADVPELAAAFLKAKGGQPRRSNKEQVSQRLDADVLTKFRADGPGWQTRINEVLRRAAMISPVVVADQQLAGATIR